jgi:uncharacterized membrane protein YgdD (TMEM256/DUF423 family)
MKFFLSIAAIYGFFGILLGAVGTHALKGKISPNEFNNYRIGVEYLFFHIAPLLYLSHQNKSLLKLLSGICFSIGILFFSGSNFILPSQPVHLLNVSFLKPITPLGGIMMMAGWFLFFFDSFKKASK